MCSFDIQNKTLRIFLYSETNKVESKVDLKPITDLTSKIFSNWQINYAIPNDAKSNW